MKALAIEPMRCAILLLGTLLFGCGASTEKPAGIVELKLITWNILHGADAQGVLNLEAKARWLAEQSADVIFLQEVDSNCQRSGSVDQMAELSQVTVLEPLFGAFMPFQSGDYGMGLLTSLPVRSSRLESLPMGDEPRIALIAELEVLGQTLLVVNVHFNWTSDDTSRFTQAMELLDKLAYIDQPVIVAGDFNDTPDSRTMALFEAAGFEYLDPPQPSFDSIEPSRDIDHLLLRSGNGLSLIVLSAEVLNANQLSDHRPVSVRVQVDK